MQSRCWRLSLHDGDPTEEVRCQQPDDLQGGVLLPQPRPRLQIAFSPKPDTYASSRGAERISRLLGVARRHFKGAFVATSLRPQSSIVCCVARA